jgi:hypothetical protein
MEKRSSPRIELDLAVTAVVDGARIPCTIKNLSDTGAFLLVDSNYRDTLPDELIDKRAFFTINAMPQSMSTFYGRIVRFCCDVKKRFIAVQLINN